MLTLAEQSYHVESGDTEHLDECNYTCSEIAAAVKQERWKLFKGVMVRVFVCILHSAVYVLQMFHVILQHFDILLSIVMKATEWKTLLEGICQRNRIHMNPGFNHSQTVVCLFTERERIKPPSDWLLIDPTRRKCVCLCSLYMCLCEYYPCWDKDFTNINKYSEGGTTHTPPPSAELHPPLSQWHIRNFDFFFFFFTLSMCVCHSDSDPNGM